ncbi:MAG TPA: MetQ/NlpA family ABC transporter substrate-binding protein [Bacillota bacterium]|nr:MetQ/NlpA family ABC transporter substrate-binding protein [Bacillota bacterium]
MKKIFGVLTICFVLLLAACGDDNENTSQVGSENDEGNVTLTVGAQSVPHAEILEEAKPLLEEKNITLEIEEYQDFVLPNDDLADGRLDANYFQHIPYLEQTVEDTGYDLDYIGKIHIEPMGIYSQDYESIDDIPDGTEVILSNSVADHGRVLSLFEEAGLITLEDGIDVDDMTLDDIVENPKNLTFSPDYEPAILPELYESESDILAAINTNYAIDAGLDPGNDALFIEPDDSPYANVIAVRSEDKDNESLKTLVEVLQSDDIQDFIEDKYEGAIVPVKSDD